MVLAKFNSSAKNHEVLTVCFHLPLGNEDCDLNNYQSRNDVEIQSTPERIYRALTNWEERSRWRPGLKMKWEGSAQAFVGQVVSFDVEGSYPPASFCYRITGLEHSRRIYMEYMDSALSGRAAMEVTPLEKGCQVSFYWMKVEPRGLWAWIYFRFGFGLSAQIGRAHV